MFDYFLINSWLASCDKTEILWWDRVKETRYYE